MLVATDIAARGIHVDDIGIVVHIDPPAEHKAYLHRSGRTARAGAEGVVVTLATPDQRRDVSDLMRKVAIKPTNLQVRSGDAAITELVGPAPRAWSWQRRRPNPRSSPAAAAPSPGAASRARGRAHSLAGRALPPSTPAHRSAAGP